MRIAKLKTPLLRGKQPVKRFIQNTSIRNKLTLAIMGSSMLVLLLVFGAYVAVEVYSSRTTLIRETATLAGSLGENCKQLLLLKEFDAAEKSLSSLELQQNIHAAYLFDGAGKPVAEFLDQSESHFLLKHIPIDFAEKNRPYWTEAAEQKMSTSWAHLGLFTPLFQGEQRVGTLYLLSDTHGLYQRLSGVLFWVLLTLALLLFVSWCLSGWLQKPVARPLLSLVETMGEISAQKDYTLRAAKQGEDEIGVLVDGFNRMLDQIERHRAELEKHQASLEKIVLQRTAELRNTVEQLHAARQQAEAASEAKSQFLANITHELRTPLIGVLGMNELLFRTAMTEQQEMLANTVRKSGEDLLRLINDVLDFSRIEAGALQLEETEFELYRVVEDVVNLLWTQAADKGLKLYAEIPLETTWKVRGDEQRIRQIVMNLLGNAIKFTDSGEISVRLALQPRADERGLFIIEIEDTGIGLDAEAQQRIFSAFYQADSTTTREYGGTGLGLEIVRQLVALMAGQVELESEPQQGSRFRVKLPLPQVVQTRFSLPEHLQQQAILIQEDEPRYRQQLAQRLLALGLQPVETAAVADAWYRLEAAQRSGQPYTMMILSAAAMLPDGQRLMDAIRQHASAGCLRRILLFSGQMDPVQQKANETCLYRPLTWSKLTAALSRSWHELHLVATPVPSKRMASNPSTVAAERFPLALVGGGAASHELIRMALRNSPFAVEVVASFERLIQQQPDRRYQAVVLDLAATELDTLEKLLRVQPFANLILLHQPSDQVELLEPLIAGRLEKPFQPRELLRMLLPVAEKAGRYSAAEEQA